MTDRSLVTTFDIDLADEAADASIFPLFAADPLTTIGTDFIFDALNPAGYSGGVLPAVDAVLPSAGLVNLARDTALALSRTGAVTAVPSDVSHKPTFSGDAWVFAPTTKLPLSIHKVGVTNNRVCEPTLEGFEDFIDIVWFQVTTAPTVTAALFGAGQGGSGSENGLFAMVANRTLSMAPGTSTSIMALNSLHQAAVHYAFDVGGDASTYTLYLDGLPVGSPTAGRDPSAYTASNGFALAQIGAVPGYEVFTGKIHRVVREFCGISGVDPDDFVARDYDLNLARFS